MAKPCRSECQGDASPARAGGARWGVFALLSAALLGTGGCGADYRAMAFPDHLENPTFPGVFTGEQGEWVIYRQESRSATPTPRPDR